jgi:hypothetical protein
VSSGGLLCFRHTASFAAHAIMETLASTARQLLKDADEIKEQRDALVRSHRLRARLSMDRGGAALSGVCARACALAAGS